MVKPDKAKKFRTRPTLKTYAFKAGFTHELELAPLGESVSRAKEIITQPHRADFYHILWIQSGKAVHLLDFKAIPMNPNSLLFIRKNSVLMYDKSGNYDGKVLRFTDRFFIRNEDDSRYLRESPLFSSFNEKPLISIAGKDASFLMLLHLLEKELAAPLDSHQHASLQNLIHNFMILSERHFGESPEMKRVRDPIKELGQKFIDGVEAGFREEKKVSAYAERLGVTEKRLQSVTSEAFGKPPKMLIDERIHLEAKRLLLFSGATVKEISFELGFDEVTNFVKYFRKHSGTTPSEFRTKYRN